MCCLLHHRGTFLMFLTAESTSTQFSLFCRGFKKSKSDFTLLLWDCTDLFAPTQARDKNQLTRL